MAKITVNQETINEIKKAHAQYDNYQIAACYIDRSSDSLGIVRSLLNLPVDERIELANVQMATRILSDTL